MIEIRAARPDEHDTLLALNNAATPHVNALEPAQFDWIARHADYIRLAEVEGTIAGFVMAIARGTAYWSANYAWFTEKYSNFIYLDRVVVAPNVRRRGVARALYADLIRVAHARWPRIALEVNVRPPNPGSMAFHEALGFERVGARVYDANEVAMLVLPLESAGR